MDRRRQERLERDKDLLLEYERVLHQEEYDKLDQAMRQRNFDNKARLEALANFNKSSGQDFDKIIQSIADDNPGNNDVLRVL